MDGWTGATASPEDDTQDLVDDGELVLPAELEETVEAFLLATSQWRWIADGWNAPRRTGLDYGGLRAALALARRRITPETFDDLRYMEAEALRAFAE